MSKLFVVVRADLPIGAQLAQAVHAALTAADATGTVAELEAVIAAPVAILHVPHLAALEAVYLRARDRGVGDLVGESIAVLWAEPDLDGQATAAAFFGHGAAGVVRPLPLAFGPRCPRCGAAVELRGGAVATHDYPPPCRRVCDGSGGAPIPGP